MARTILVDDLIDDVRSLIDESNQEDVSDTADIIPALNRAQDEAASILSKHYSAPLRRYTIIPMVAGQVEYDIPEDAFEERIELIEIKIANYFYPLKALSPEDATYIETQNISSTPYAYVTAGSRLRILPNVNPAYSLRIWYEQDPAKLVKQQGRIEEVDTTTNSILVDEVGGDLTTESDSLKSFVNVVDGQTGRRKATLQIKNIVGNEIFFKGTLSNRTSIRGVSIDTSLETLLINSDPHVDDGSTITVDQDDYICLSEGTCVPIFKKPLYNYLVRYAVADLRGVIDGSDSYTAAELTRMEKVVTRSWSGRQNTDRVKRSIGMWSSSNASRASRSKYK